MADTFKLREGAEYRGKIRRIEGEIKERVDGCLKPQCWLLKEGETGQVYIKRKITVDGWGRSIYIRRFLFLTTFGYLPEGRKIEMICENPKRCVNPAHATYRGFNMPYEWVMELISRNWITKEQAEELYLKKKKVKHIGKVAEKAEA